MDASPDETVDVPLDRARLATIAAAIVCIAVVGIGLSLSTPLIALLLDGRGVSATVIGLNTAVASLAVIVSGPYIPLLAQRLGVRNLLLGSLVIGGLSLGAFAFFTSLTAWFILRFIYGAMIGALFVLSEYWINAAAPPGRRGFIMGIYATILSLGFAAGPAILAFAGGPDENLFFIGAAFFAIAIVPILLGGRSAPGVEGHTSGKVWTFIVIAPVATLAGFVFGAVEQASFAFMAIYGEAIGLAVRDGAFLLTLFGLGNVVSQVPFGLLADRVDRRLLLFVCAALSFLGAVAMPLASDQPLMLMSLVFATGGLVGALYTVGLAHLGARFTGAALASANAAFVMLYSLGMLAGAPAVGVFYDALPPHGFALGIAALCGAYALLVLWRIMRRET